MSPRKEIIGDAELCEECGSEIDDLNVEAWEESGKFLCADCAEALFEELANAD